MSKAREKGEKHQCTVSVVIPFYQKERGLLKRALASVFSQNITPLPRIIVVDDASPVPAAEEIEELSPEQKSLITIVWQENAGPGAARNNGLDHLTKDTDYLAFLDSDDEWLPGHLKRAVFALDSGNDLFFSNYLEIGETTGRFETNDYLQQDLQNPLPGASGLYVYPGDLVGMVLLHCPIQTSTLVFKYATFDDLRFRDIFLDSCEDLMFFFEMATRSPRVAFSMAIGTQFGTGVNIYRGMTQYSDAQLLYLFSYAIFGSEAKAFHLNKLQITTVNDRLKKIRKDVVGHLMHRIKRRKQIPWSEMLQYLRADPPACLQIPWILISRSLSWALNRPNED